MRSLRTKVFRPDLLSDLRIRLPLPEIGKVDVLQGGHHAARETPCLKEGVHIPEALPEEIPGVGGLMGTVVVEDRQEKVIVHPGDEFCVQVDHGPDDDEIRIRDLNPRAEAPELPVQDDVHEQGFGRVVGMVSVGDLPDAGACKGLCPGAPP